MPPPICDLIIWQGDLLASPILEALCKSFYEEEKWQRSLLLHMNSDNEWMSSVPIKMVALAATAVSTHLVGDSAPLDLSPVSKCT